MSRCCFNPHPVVAGAFLVHAVLLLLATNAFAAEPAPAAVLAEFDVACGGDVILVPISSASRRFRFILDTGFTGSCFNVRHRPMLGHPTAVVPGRAAGGMRLFERFLAPPMWLGAIALQPDKEVACIDLSKEEAYCGHAIDGILGMDALKHLVLNIDFDRGKVRILRSADNIAGRSVPIAWHRRSHMTEGPFISVKVDGVPHEFLLDSGSIWQTIGTMDTEPFDALVTRGSIMPLMHASYQWESLGSMTNMSLGRARSFEIAGLRHENAILGRVAFWNTLGLGFLARYIVTLDFPRSVLYLSPGKGFSRPDNLDGSGLYVGSYKNELVVHKVKIDTPGHLAGVWPRDVIVSLDGDATAGWSQYRIGKAFSTPGIHTLVVLRGNRRLELRLQIPAAQPQQKQETTPPRPFEAPARQTRRKADEEATKGQLKLPCGD